MKATIALWMIATLSGMAQGTILFNNRVGENVNAPVSFLDGTRVGAGFRAQLWVGPEGTALDQLTPLQPTTTFPRLPQNVPGYVNAVVIEVPGTAPEERVVVVMRAFDGPAWEESACRGQSAPFVVPLAGGTSPPAELIGLQPLQVNCIPEPSVLVLIACGGAACACSHRALRKLLLV